MLEVLLNLIIKMFKIYILNISPCLIVRRSVIFQLLNSIKIKNLIEFMFKYYILISLLSVARENKKLCN